MSRASQSLAPAGETLYWLRRRLVSLEQQERYECAYALRMELAEWILGSEDGNLRVPRFPEPQ